MSISVVTRLLSVLIVAAGIPAAAATSSAEELTLVVSGSTHAMLYPCSCPKEPDGGVGRRATALRKILSSRRNVCVLDSGSFTGGGIRDEYAQEAALDLARSAYNVKAMETMGYDFAGIGSDEFNFGKEFLEKNIIASSLKLVSANFRHPGVHQYGLKKFKKVTVGITSLTPAEAVKQAPGISVTGPEQALKQTIVEMRSAGADLIVVMSNLVESENTRLIREVPGIDIFIPTHSSSAEPSVVMDSVLVVRPSWQGRKLTVCTITEARGKVIGSKVEEMRLSDEIEQSPVVRGVVPACFRDADCRKPGTTGTCANGGTIAARCSFAQAPTVPLTVITAKDCLTCDVNIELGLRSLRNLFPGLSVSYVYYPEQSAKDLIGGLGVSFLPLYLLGQEAEKSPNFGQIRETLDLKGGRYLVKPEVAGIAFYLDRPKTPETVDVFIGLYNKETPELLENLKEFTPNVHFQVTEQNGSFEAGNGPTEIEECLRSVCVGKYYPAFFYNYILCRARKIGSAWWDDCAQGLSLDRIKSCAKGSEGISLLKENIQLNKELEVGVQEGATYLLHNQEIFGSLKTPSKEELRKLISGSR